MRPLKHKGDGICHVAGRQEGRAVTSARDGLQLLRCFDIAQNYELEISELVAVSRLDWLRLSRALTQLARLGYIESLPEHTYRLSPLMFGAESSSVPNIYRFDDR